MPVLSTNKSNAGKNNFISDALGRQHEYRLAVEFILELLTENTMRLRTRKCGGDRL